MSEIGGYRGNEIGCPIQGLRLALSGVSFLIKHRNPSRASECFPVRPCGASTLAERKRAQVRRDAKFPFLKRDPSQGSGDSQTCSFSYDDLSRVVSDQCGNPWAQTFGYDAFGNISKAGSSTFNPGYGSGNHVSGFGYDSDGNVTSDGAYSYTYDTEGRATVISGRSLYYDAFNRLAEVSGGGGATTNIVYSPDGLTGVPDKRRLCAWWGG